MVKSLNIGRAVYEVETIIIGSLNPYMMSKSRTPPKEPQQARVLRADGMQTLRPGTGEGRRLSSGPDLMFYASSGSILGFQIRPE
jgi:hypothetical protein